MIGTIIGFFRRDDPALCGATFFPGKLQLAHCPMTCPRTEIDL